MVRHLFFSFHNSIQGAEHLKIPIHITPSRASHSAIRTVEKLGGSVVCRYYNPLSLRDCIKGRTDRFAAAPTRREDIGQAASFTVLGPRLILFSIVWYTNKNNRGYLAPSVVQQISHLPFVDKRWKVLSNQLSGWKREHLVAKKETTTN
jgi:large subunit ribosomal protein L15